MAFTAKEIKNRSSWLSPDLLKACKSYFALPENPDEVPAVDGDPFTGSQEYPDIFLVGYPTIMETSARVLVTFTWKDGHSTNGMVVLIQVKGKWLIDDVKFPEQGSMRELLALQ